MDERCPCGSGLAYEHCCEPYIRGTRNAPTAEALMRSRYAAYVKHEIDFILRTCTGDRAAGIDEKRTRDWSEKSQWLGLAIHSVSGGGSADSEGSVEFTAFYTAKGLRDSHHELARFKKINGQWLYDEGEIVPATVVRDGPRVGRNDPCPCGSGKKYKLCHGR